MKIDTVKAIIDTATSKIDTRPPKIDTEMDDHTEIATEIRATT